MLALPVARPSAPHSLSSSNSSPHDSLFLESSESQSWAFFVDAANRQESPHSEVPNLACNESIMFNSNTSQALLFK